MEKRQGEDRGIFPIEDVPTPNKNEVSPASNLQDHQVKCAGIRHQKYYTIRIGYILSKSIQFP
jgi:hypothetical protein